MTAATNSRLTETEKAQVRYWIHTIGGDLAAADTRNKYPSLEKWSNNLSDNIDYDARLGLYDKGVAVICGLLRRGPYSGKYLSVLDFDDQEALESFLKLLEVTLQKLAHWTRVEWHENQAKIHVFLITSTPFKNIAPGKGLEVMGKKKLTFVSPSINKDGNPYKPYHTEQIVILDDVNKMKIENIVDTFMLEKTGRSYLSEDAKKQYIEYLERPDTILTEGERHNGLKTLGVSWFHRYAGEWAAMTDEERFERLKTYNEKQCKPPKPEQELVDIWEWIKQKHTGSRQEQRDKREDEQRNNGTESNPHLSGNMHYQTNNNPPTFIMADRKDKRLIEIIFRTYQTSGRRNGGGESVTLRQSIYTKPYLACIPDKIIIHKSPIESIMKDGERYTIHFVGAEQSTCRVIRHKTISEIASELKQSGNVLADFGVEIALSAMIKAFERKGMLEESNDTELVGFLIDDNGNLVASNVNINRPGGGV